MDSICYFVSKTMLIPAMLCGNTQIVTAACRKHIAQFKRGCSWLEAGTMIDVKDAPGLIMLEAPSSLLVDANVRLYAPFREFEKIFAKHAASEDLRAFDEALKSAWSVLSLLTPSCYRWLQDGERADRLLDALVGYWTELDAVGARYTIGVPRGRTLWEVAHVLHFVLARRGVPRSRLSQPLPTGGIATLLPSKN